jgi:pyruvate/2-oxoglutarate dehydrogenase complex dihydrolipoamide acyltransferase (E2) component
MLTTCYWKSITLERPVAEEGPAGDLMMYLALSYDPRVVDGRGARDLPHPVKDQSSLPTAPGG